MKASDRTCQVSGRSTQYYRYTSTYIARSYIHAVVVAANGGQQAVHRSKHKSFSFCKFLAAGNEALCKKLGREAILMVASTEAVGGVLRCVTLAVKDDLALEKWIHSLQKVRCRCRSDAEEAKERGDVPGKSFFTRSRDCVGTPSSAAKGLA